LGCLPPVRSWRPLSALPIRYSLHRPCARKRLRVRSSLGVQPSCTVCPEVSARSLSASGHLSWGSMPLQRSGRRESTARRLPGRAPRCCRDCADGSHPVGYGAAHRFSQPRSGLLPPSAVLPFSDRWRSWGLALQGFIPATQPWRFVAASVPSWRCSHRLASPRPRWGNLRARRPSPRFPTCAFVRLQGLCPRGSRSVSPRHG
jgi:hypothetical protein